MRSRHFTFVFTLLLALTPSLARAQTDLIPRAWPETFIPAPTRKTNQIKLELISLLFGEPGDVGLYSGPPTTSFSFTGEVDRVAYDNYNLLKTWTVIDHLQLRLSEVPYQIGKPESTPSFAFAGIQIGARGVLQLRDIRQMSPDLAHELTPVRREKFFGVADQPMLSNELPDPKDENPYVRGFSDPSAGSVHRDTYADVTTAKILNAVTLPFRLPLSRRNLKSMSNDEVMSYNIAGEAVFGASVGYHVALLAGLTIGPTASVETHLNGEFEVAVLKESDRYAQVRVSKLTGKGANWGVKIAVDTTASYSGFLNVDFRVIPFEFSSALQSTHDFSVAYRYDLDSDEGREAFHRAVLGRTDMSEYLSGCELGQLSPSVAPVFIRTFDSKASDSKYGIDLSFIRTHLKKLHDDESESDVTEDGTTQHISKTSREEQTEADGFMHPDEIRVENLSVFMDAKGFEKGIPESLVIIGENRIDNSSTRGFELNRYGNEVSALFRDGNYFPKFPEQMLNAKGKVKKTKYGRTSFYYGFTLTEKEIGAFLRTPPDQVFSQASALGLDLVPTDFINALVAFDAHDGKATYAALRNLFPDRSHSREYIKLISRVLTPGSYSKFLVAHNQAFGGFYNRGREFTPMDHTLQVTDTTMNEGPDANRMIQDPDASVTKLTWSKNARGNVEIHFRLANTPKFILFRNEAFDLQGHRTEMEVVALNLNGRFKSGDNTIELDPKNADSVIHQLTDQFSTWNQLQFTVSYTQNSKDFGPAANLDVLLYPRTQ
jgi:hypothetical protein